MLLRSFAGAEGLLRGDRLCQANTTQLLTRAERRGDH